MRNKSTYLRQQRDEALFEVYCQALKEHDFRRQDDAINYARTHPAPRFFISPEFCYSVITRMMRGEPMGLKGEARVRKFNELYRRYKIERVKPENYELTTFQLCSVIVCQEAPEFYLNYRASRGIIQEQKEKKLEEWRRRLKW